MSGILWGQWPLSACWRHPFPGDPVCAGGQRVGAAWFSCAGSGVETHVFLSWKRPRPHGAGVLQGQQARVASLWRLP